ncbi:MAG: hypothetical protein ABIJ09_15350 [Pseudomonadota bacterium]
MLVAAVTHWARPVDEEAGLLEAIVAAEPALQPGLAPALLPAVIARGDDRAGLERIMGEGGQRPQGEQRRRSSPTPPQVSAPVTCALRRAGSLCTPPDG